MAMLDNQTLMKGFLNSDENYRPVTMWWWNDELCEDEITAQLEAFKSKGVNDVFVNHVWGARDEYLGERFFEVVRYTVKEAKRLGMRYWIYDEFNWPSGVAGGKVIKEHPEHKARVLADTKLVLDAECGIDEFYIKGEFVSAKLVYTDAPEGGATDVSDSMKIEQEKRGFWASWRNDSCGRVTLHILSTTTDGRVTPAAKWGKYSNWEEGYINSLDEKAMRAFIDSTHEKYKEAVGEEFGKTVMGVFTDEIQPNYYPWGSRTTWNRQMNDRFLAKYGYSPEPWLHALVEKPANDQEKKVRYHYWRLVAELMSEAHVRQVYDWCDKENLQYTGHFCGEEHLMSSMYQTGDFFDCAKWMHIPGIDSIFSRTHIEDEDFNTGGKMGASWAKFFNRERLLCETYTMSLSKLRYDEMRRIANRLMILGVNMLQYMGSSYSLEGPKNASPISGGPSFGDNDPMFTYRDRFGDYVSRVQYLSAKTRPAGNVLLMCPNAAVYVNTDFNTPVVADRVLAFSTNPMWHIDQMNMGLVNALLALNIEFDLFGDSMADLLEAEDGVAKLCGGEYDTVIMPYTGETTRGVVNMAERLRAAGVHIVFVNELPQLIIEEACREAPFGAAPETEGVTKLGEKVSFIRISDNEELKKLKNTRVKQMLLETVGADKRTLGIRHNGDICTGLRSSGKDTVIFLCNDSPEERCASVDYIEGMQLLDPDTCREVKLNPVDGRADIRFGPYQLYTAVISEEKVDWPAEDVLFVESEPLATVRDCCDIVLEKGNILAADWKYAHYTDAENSIVVPESELADAPFGKVPAKYSGKNEHGLMVFDFEVKDIPEDVTLFAEYRYVLRCELNGVRIDKDWQRCRLWGPRCASLDVTSLLRKGANRLAMVFTMPEFNLPFTAPFMMFRGSFEADYNTIWAKRDRYAAAPVSVQGAPRFYGDAVYRFRVNLTAKEARDAAFVSVDTREAAALFVNGICAGNRMWSPQKYNVEGLLTEGENTLEFRVTLPMWNIFSAKGDVLHSGLNGAPVIEKKRIIDVR